MSALVSVFMIEVINAEHVFKNCRFFIEIIKVCQTKMHHFQPLLFCKQTELATIKWKNIVFINREICVGAILHLHEQMEICVEKRVQLKQLLDRQNFTVVASVAATCSNFSTLLL